jgi:ketosteroid isomerase-like protein
MSEENLERVRRGVEDVKAFWSMLDEHVVWDLRRWPYTLDMAEVYVGRDAVIEASRRYWGTWADYSVEIEELIDAGPSVIIVSRERGKGRSSGVPVDRLNPQLWTFRGDRIIRWESFETRAEALLATGLTE